MTGRPCRRRSAAALALAMLTLASVPAWARAQAPAADTAPEPAQAPVADTTPEPAPEAPPPIRNPDPWEPFNRFIHRMNETGDIYFVKPLAQGWDFLTPSPFQTVVTNFNNNLQLPVILGNNLLQLKPRHVGDDFLRLFFNLSFGIGGLLDMATWLDIPQNDEDFGQTLGYWGVPEGPFLVLPVFGPSTVRDGIGRGVDSVGTLYFSYLPFYATLVVRGTEIVNLRAQFLEEIDANRVESFDYYVFLRNAYLQNRRVKVERRGQRTETAAPDESLYDFEDDADWDEDFDEDFDE